MSPARKAALAAAGAAVVLLPLLDPLTRARVLNGILFQQGVWILAGLVLLAAALWVLVDAGARLQAREKARKAARGKKGKGSRKAAEDPSAAGQAVAGKAAAGQAAAFQAVAVQTLQASGAVEAPAGQAPARPGTPAWLPTAVLGVLLLGTAAGALAQWWDRATTLRDSVAVSAEPLPEMALRAPFVVAERQASSNLSGTVGNIGETDYLPPQDAYSTLVNRPGLFQPGYEVLLSQRLALTGQAEGTRCSFSAAAQKRMGGVFGHSLERAIAARDFMLIAKERDAWGYCDGDTPVVVVPLTKLHNWLAPRDVPAGVAVYNGTSGELRIQDTVEPGDLPGPAVSISQAERINGSLQTYGGSPWSTLLVQTGLTDQPKDEDDTNLGNFTNFSLAVGPQGGEGYVSPFTSRASSRSIDVVTVLDTARATAGQPASVALYRLASPRQSNAATADRIKADYADLPGWATGLEIMEIVPGGEGTWHASIGLRQNVTHRVELKADGSSCLLTATGQRLSCSGTAGPAEPVEDGGSGVEAGTDLSTLDDAELMRFHEAIVAELHRRLTAP